MFRSWRKIFGLDYFYNKVLFAVSCPFKTFTYQVAGKFYIIEKIIIQLVLVLVETVPLT